MQQDLFAQDPEEKWRLIRPNSTRVTCTPRDHNGKWLPHLAEHGLVIAMGCPGCCDCRPMRPGVEAIECGRKLVMVHLDEAEGPWDSFWWDLEAVELGAPDRPHDWIPKWVREEFDAD